MNKTRKVFLSLFFLSWVLCAKAQTSLSDTSSLAIAKKNTIQRYTKTASAYAELYNGRSYDEYRQQEDEHPYLFLDWTEGTIRYQGKDFENVPLLYDLSSDQVVTEHSSGNKISLLSNRVAYFTIKEHRFEWREEKGIAAGFYEVLYAGKTQLIAKREKTKQEKIAATTLTITFEEKVRYYLVKDNQFVSVSNKRTLINALAGDQPDIKKKLSAAKLDFKKEKETSFAMLVKMFDQLRSAL